MPWPGIPVGPQLAATPLPGTWAPLPLGPWDGLPSDSFSHGRWTEADPKEGYLSSQRAPKLLSSPEIRNLSPHHSTRGDKGLEERMSIHLYWRKPCPATALNTASPAAARRWAGSDDHLQLPGILDDLLGQFRGGDGGIFWLLLLAGKAVVVVEAQNPPSLQEGKGDRWVG